jgi:hypothetical protein
MDSDYYAEEFRLLNLPEPKQTKKMQIQIIATSVETKPTQKGSYQQLEVTFKNLTFQGKVEAKKLMSFGAGANAFKVLSQAQSGNVFEVTTVKNDKGYIDWTAVTQTTGDAAPQAAASVAGASKSTPSPKSTYETPEERAQRQILIVRQSSVSSAVSSLSAGAKTPPKAADVIAYAKELEAYVFGVEAADTGPTGFDDLPDFEAEVN